ncbi:hypothetical protein MSIM_30820 [Mycobacterium simiae]|nr:hypothetical protein MSIM_30820 [Mycobacterium simiae]
MSSAKIGNPRDTSGAAQNAANTSALNLGAVDVVSVITPPTVGRFDRARSPQRVPARCGRTITSEVIAAGTAAGYR